MTLFKISNKVVWRKELKIDIAKNFYPSLYKELIQKEKFLNDNFRVEIVDASQKKLQALFFPLYFKEVASRADFTLTKESVVTTITEKVKQRPYKFMFIYFQKKLIFAWLFCFKNDGLFMAYRAYNKNFDRKLSHKAPISYWAEKMIFDYGKENGVAFFSHGKDSHPYYGKSRIGLPLYKIKTGMRPKKPALPYPPQEISEEALKNNTPVLFFYNEDNENFYRNCHLYFPCQSLDASYITEFEKVMRWANLKFDFTSY